ncbi:hypothetical protein MLD38_016484 [Melastoma candidum]|uniref:Uncharacterized protein n=1 Tax=Melastoma candidum TaxID=119954 RepID=A0ACB9QLS1_9MYRT|nr:hypothetical protein MLD38_016484 [Melastoma candidum]
MGTDGNSTSSTHNQTGYANPQANGHRHELFHSDAMFAAAISVTSVILVLVVCLIIVLSRRLQSTGKNRRSDGNHRIGVSYSVQNSVHYSSSPEVKSGCLSGGASISLASAGLSRGNRRVQVYSYKELEAATNGFSEANVIGDGGFGVVYRGMLSDRTVAAIKKLHLEGKQGERAFRIEVDLQSRLHSPYLVELLGYCADQNHRLLVFEYMPHGGLQHHLHSPSTQCKPLDWGTRLRIALDCAMGLEFLHEHTIPSVIHRDFKCSNVLLDHDFRAKVSDFGLAKMGSDKINGQISTRVLGTTGYLAPEYASTGNLTTKSDVYSYGVVLLELLTGRVPVDSKRPPGEHVLVSWALPRLTNRDKVVEMVDPTLKGNYPKKELIQVAAIAAVCVQPEADYRPLMVDIVQSLIPLVRNYISISSSPSLRIQSSAVSPGY